MNKKIQVIVVLCVALFLCGCSAIRDLGSAYPGREYRDDALMAQAKQGQKKIIVYLDQQAGELFVDGKLAFRFPVSTGIPGHSTPSGSFTIIDKELNNRSSLYGTIYDRNGNVVVPYADTKRDRVPTGGYYLGASMPYTMKFTDLCAFHAGIVPEVPTYTSHGCIHLTEETAKEMYELCPYGTPVHIYSRTPARVASNQ